MFEETGKLFDGVRGFFKIYIDNSYIWYNKRPSGPAATGSGRIGRLLNWKRLRNE